MRHMLCRAVWVAGVLLVVSTPSAQAQVPVPTTTAIRVQTTVMVPNGGSILIGGYSQVSESRSEYGAPLLRNVPYSSRVIGNVGYGRSTVSGRVGASVRIIDLREEEYRQTGFRSP